MGRLTESLREAREEMEKLAKISEGLVDTLSADGGGGGGSSSSGGSAPVESFPPQVFNFNTTIAAPQTISSGGGGGGGGLVETDLQKIARYFGINAFGKSEAYIKQLLAEIQRLSKKMDDTGGGVNFRMKGGG